MADGIKLGGAYYEISADSAPLIQEMARAEAASKKSAAAIAQATGLPEKAVARYAQQAIRAHQQAAAEAERSAARIAAASQNASRSFSDAAKGAAEFTAGVAGIAIGSAAVAAAISKISTETQRASQAQFTLAATFKGTAGAYAEFTKQQAEATRRTTTEVQEAIAAFGSLSNRYALNTEQIKELTKRSADLAAVKGVSTVDAAKRLEAALRGEAESAEALGLTLNSDYLKKFADMTAEQRKNWETLDPLIKAQITYREVLKQTADIQGKAVERTKEGAGAYDNLKTAASNLALTLGNQAAPAVQTLTNRFADLLANMDKVLKKNAELNAAPFAPSVVTDTEADIRRRIEAALGITPLPADRRADDQGPREGADVAAAADARRKAELIAAAEARAARQSELEEQERAAKRKAEAEIKAIEAERDAKKTWYDEERTRIEARRYYQLEDIETRKKAAIDALEEERQASKDSFDAAIKEAEQEKKARLDTAEAVRDAQIAALKERERLNEIARQSEDRQVSDRRQQADRTLSDARAYEDRQRTEANAAELRRLETRHKKILDDLEAETEAAQKASDQRIRNLDRQADKARKNSDQAIRNIERQAQKEDDRHRAALQALDDEKDARLAILQTQLDALDAQEKAEGSARRTADLQKRVADAQKAATLARGTGTPEQIAAAQAALTNAYRLNNQQAIEKASRELETLAGHGNDAILKADEELAAAQDDLRQEGIDQTRDAERAKLRAAQDAIKDEIAARKEAEEDRTRERKRELDADKQAEQDRLKARLDGLEKKKQATQDASAREIEDIRIRTERERQSYADAVEARREAYAEQGRLLDERRKVEDRDREDRRLAEDRERTDRRAAEDEALRLQKAAIDAALEQERRDAEQHYNGPNGIITQLRKASTDSEREYSRRLAAARASFEAERKQAELIYRNPEKNGLLDLLESAREAEIKSLDASKERWEQWSKAVQEAVKAAMDALKNGGGADTPATSAAPSGQNTSSSAATTTSRKSGKKVQGDVVSWLNDAMDITGVGNNWLAGLQRLVQLESGGDPHNQNPQDVIDPRTGRNLGNAKGLLQMLSPTFSENRDKSLPDDIFDPVANAVAAIRYIQKRYGHVNHIPGLFQGKFEGYDSGHLFREPTMTVGLRSGSRAVIAERRPELLVSGAATARLINRAPMVGPMPTRDYAALGDQFARLATAGGGNGSSSSVINITANNVHGSREVARDIARLQHRRELMKGGRANGR